MIEIYAKTILLASAWSFVSALIAVIVLAIRTALEDRMLHMELPGGFTKYATRVRFRPIPGVW